MEGSISLDLKDVDTGSSYAADGADTVAIVMPVFKHSVFLAEAIESALAQRCRYDIKVVIVDDGCPFVETEVVGRAYALASPQVVYLRKANGGLSSARNYGIEYCLRTMPNLAAVYFLDADNRITPSMVQEAMALLESSTDVDWIYPNIDKFGIPGATNYNTAYSRLLHVSFDNICEAGSLVSKRLLDAGIRFDEAMKSGFEDWDFWLQAIGAGFRGRNHPYFGFDYRQRAESMLRDSNRVRSAILGYLREKHKHLFAADTLLRWEHEEAPRFAFVCIDTNSVELFTDPKVDHEIISLEEFVRRYWAAILEPDTFGVPPFILFMQKVHLDDLIRAGLIHNLLWLGDRLCRSHNFVSLHLEHDDARIQIDVREINDKDRREKRPMAWMCTLDMFRACIEDVSDDWVRSLRLPTPSPKTAEIVVRGPFSAEIKGAALSATNALLAVMGTMRDSGYAQRDTKRWMWRCAYLPDRSQYYKHLEASIGAAPIMPRLVQPDGPVRVGFLLPIASFGGVEKVAYAMAKALRQLGCEPHLFILGKAVYQNQSGDDRVFESVNFLSDEYPLWGGPHVFAGHELLMGGDPSAKSEELLGLLTGLDVVVNCQVAPANAVFGELRRRGVKVINHVHVLDKTFTGRDAGHPYLTLAFEHAFDLILTCSKDLLHWLHAMGVPLAKLLEVSNAPSYEMSSSQIDRVLAARRARSVEEPLRVLFMGRLDMQKGIERLYGMAAETRRRGMAIDWQIIGSEVVSENHVGSWTSRFEELGIPIRPPIYAADKITDELAQADIVVLPSRWEGAPLTILEAQRLGCVPVVAAVGATGELIADGQDGILLAAHDDWDLTLQFAATLQRLCDDRADLERLSTIGAARVSTVSWQANVAALAAQLALWFPTRWKGGPAHAATMARKRPADGKTLQQRVQQS